MHSEYFEISETKSQIIDKAKNENRRVIRVGTTSCRMLESASKNGTIKPNSGWTNLFIYPPYEFNITDALITNFHQAKTTLQLLVSAFASTENIRNAYQTAMIMDIGFIVMGIVCLYREEGAGKRGQVHLNFEL